VKLDAAAASDSVNLCLVRASSDRSVSTAIACGGPSAPWAASMPATSFCAGVTYGRDGETLANRHEVLGHGRLSQWPHADGESARGDSATAIGSSALKATYLKTSTTWEVIGSCFV
jgi:hypothetical protein